MKLLGDVYVSRLKRRLMIGCLTAIIGVPCMTACLLGLFWGVFPALESSKSNLSVFLIVGSLIVTLLVLIGIPIVLVLMMNIKRARALDAIFTPLGLSGSTYMLTGRQYHGQVHGRELHVYIYRGPTIYFRLGTTLQTRVQIFARNSIPASVANIFGKPMMQINHPDLDDLAIYASDETWTSELFSIQEAVKAVRELVLLGAQWAVFHHVEIQPGEVILHLSKSKSWFTETLTDPEVKMWLQNLEILARIGESQPAPLVTVPPSPIDNPSRQGLSKGLVWVIVTMIIGIPLCAIAAGGIAYVFAMMTR